MRASKRNVWAICQSATWTKRLWEFGKRHVDIGLGSGPRIASSGFYGYSTIVTNNRGSLELLCECSGIYTLAVNVEGTKFTLLPQANSCDSTSNVFVS